MAQSNSDFSCNSRTVFKEAVYSLIYFWSFTMCCFCSLCSLKSRVCSMGTFRRRREFSSDPSRWLTLSCIAALRSLSNSFTAPWSVPFLVAKVCIRCSKVFPLYFEPPSALSALFSY
eukprot:UN16794